MVSQNDLLNPGINRLNELLLSAIVPFFTYTNKLLLVDAQSGCETLEVESIASMVSLVSLTDNSRRESNINESWNDFEIDEINKEKDKLDLLLLNV